MAGMTITIEQYRKGAREEGWTTIKLSKTRFKDDKIIVGGLFRIKVEGNVIYESPN